MENIQNLVGALLASVMLAVPAAQAQDGHNVESVTLKEIRGTVFCEFLLITSKDVTIYNTSANDTCDVDAFGKLDPAKIAQNHGAVRAQLNGPHYWIMDEQTLGLGDTKSFGSIEARYAATLPLSALGSGKGSEPYKPYISAKDQTMIFKAGSPVYELVAPTGDVYVLNAYGDEVKDGDPANLADQLQLAEGWSFRVATPDQDMTIAGTTTTPVNMVGDDMHQYYTRLDDTSK